jgi:hypothetical protein
MSDICGALHVRANSLPRVLFPFDQQQIPLNGIYLLFERGEHGHGADRIVRVGTHTGTDQLRSRLMQHFLKENKDRSIFRKNIGRALLNRDNDPFSRDWEFDRTSSLARRSDAKQTDLNRLKSVEVEVSKVIRGNFSFAVLRVEEKEKRLQLESKIISTVSLCEECGPSNSWLGRHSPKERIRESGLWLVNELYKIPLTHHELEELGRRERSTPS